MTGRYGTQLITKHCLSYQIDKVLDVIKMIMLICYQNDNTYTIDYQRLLTREKIPIHAYAFIGIEQYFYNRIKI